MFPAARPKRSGRSDVLRRSWGQPRIAGAFAPAGTGIGCQPRARYSRAASSGVLGSMLS
jgi:hypothetical protein